MKNARILFWITTGLIFLFESIMPALTSHTELAVEGIRHLGYPDYFRVELVVFKVLGGLSLILPMVPARIKEWAYAGFGINFISACIAHWVVDGFGFQTLFPVIALGILAASYLSYHRLSTPLPQEETTKHFA
ncbi:DoxX family protein [Rapidithrix thailandica]|uniref:DoxX family protein n=1 Tax=Rapidithrix thailandica TaxID=413964 RepID=A0AAW9S9P4_9BACT